MLITWLQSFKILGAIQLLSVYLRENFKYVLQTLYKMFIAVLFINSNKTKQIVNKTKQKPKNLGIAQVSINKRMY